MPPTKTQLFIFISYVLFYKNDSTINYCIKNNKRMLNYNFLSKYNLLAELKNRLKISIFLWRKSCASR